MEKVHPALGFTGGQLLVAGDCQQEASFVVLCTSVWHMLLALLGNNHKPNSNTPKKKISPKGENHRKMTKKANEKKKANEYPCSCRMSILFFLKLQLYVRRCWSSSGEALATITDGERQRIWSRYGTTGQGFHL